MRCENRILCYTEVLLVIVMLCIVTAGQALGQVVSVSAVVDGERLVLSDGLRIKLVGVDAIDAFSAAEANQYGFKLGVGEKSARKKGSLSAYYLTSLVRNRYVLVNVQDEMPSENLNDNLRYRPALVFVLDEMNRIDFLLNKKIIQEGFAAADGETDIAYKDVFVELQLMAMKQKKGLWAETDLFIDARQVATSRDSQTGDLSASCRSVQGCVWVSGDNPTMGYWESTKGYNCPCAK